MQAFGIRLGRLFGIELRIDYSWFILFLLVGVTLTAGLVPALFPELGPAAIITLGVIVTVLFFASVVIHELSHSLYAKGQGLEVRRITLFVFGGMSEILEEPRTPRQEFILAAAGPLASFGLSLIFGFVWLLGEEMNVVPLAAIGGILAAVNFLLAVFNLLPGLPLDGGRILRAVVWQATDSIQEGTRTAATGGKILSYLLMLWGAIQLVFFSLIGGVWLVLIGLFLNRAVAISYEQAMGRLLLKNVRVKDFMIRGITPVPASITVETFLQEYVLSHKEQILPAAQDDGSLAGMIDTELLPQADLSKKIAQFVVKTEPLHPGDSAAKAYDQMARSGLSSLPVIENGELAGVVPLPRIKAYLLGMHKLQYVHGQANRQHTAPENSKPAQEHDTAG